MQGARSSAAMVWAYFFWNISVSAFFAMCMKVDFCFFATACSGRDFRQDCSISSVVEMEMLQLCTKPYVL